MDVSYVDTIVAVLQSYYKLAQGGNAHKQRLIEDETLKLMIAEFVTGELAPQIALYICKVLIVLSDQRRHAAEMARRGYVEIVGRLTEQQMPPRLLAKYLQVQSRLMQAQQNISASGDVDTNEKPRQRRTKELTFVLPICNEHNQSAISQQLLKVRGVLSVSFRTCLEKQETLAIVRCKAEAEPKEIANSIMLTGFEDVGYVLKHEDGKSEVFTFYHDENTIQPQEDLPQYLDDNIEVFDPTTALTTHGSNPQSGWFTSAKSLFSFW
ncbi:hypothetical protein M3Y95_00824400 [Aphelenchoides besseyi]|nr:hypothetical protein M3Y95_00824400 [Aphelenchoides besseyi]